MQQITSEIPTTAVPFIFETDDNGFENETVKVRKWTRDEYYKMAELGFFDGKRVELIEGEIIEMSPMTKLHAVGIRKVLAILNKIFTAGFVVDSQLPMSLGKINEPEPDVAVIKGKLEDLLISHPKTAELIVEVSVSTLRLDRTKKAALYAKNKVQDYWILNLKSRCLEVYRQPKKDKKLGFIYIESRIFTETDEVSPLAMPQAKIKIADLLP